MPMNNHHASLVLQGKCADGRYSGRRSGAGGDMKNTRGGRVRRWPSRRRWHHRSAGLTPDSGAARSHAAAVQADAETGAGEPVTAAAAGETVAAAMQLAIGLLTASLDSPELEAWAAAALTPYDADGLGNFMAGLHVVSELLLRELHEVTGQPPEHILQRLAFVAEQRRGTPFAS
jgi:hypothetical protein